MSRSTALQAQALPCRRRQAGTGFSLIELLVVVAIIMILLGMLLPVIQSARARARAMYCVNNLRSQVVAAMHYAADHQGYIPRDYWYADQLDRDLYAGEVRGPHLFWAEEFMPYLGGPTPPQPGDSIHTYGTRRDEYLAPLLAEMGVYQCPSAPPTPHQPVTVKHPFSGKSVVIDQAPIDYSINGFDYNYDLGNSGPAAPLTGTLGFPKASELIYLMDGYWTGSLTYFGTHDVWRLAHTWWGAAPRMSNDDRHGEFCAVGYFDGHAGLRRFRDMTVTNFIPLGVDVKRY